MCDKQKSMGLLTQITKGLLSHGASETKSQLGNRSQYIGMSDIGSGVECLRKAVANKVYGSSLPTANEVVELYKNQQFDEIKAVLSKQLTFQRGHWFEDGILNALSENTTNLFSQLEIEAEVDGVPIKAHLDFVLVADGQKPTVRILELKSTANLPENLHTSYEVQLYGQLGMLSEFWTKPNFNLKAASGKVLFSKLTFPDLAKQAFGFDFPMNVAEVDLEGWVLSLSMSDAKAFGPYFPSEMMTDLCNTTAKHIWESAKGMKDGSVQLDSLDYCHGFNPLCDWCDHKESCPKFKAVALEDSSYNEVLAEIDQLKKNKKELTAVISEKEERIRDFYAQCKVDGHWLDAGDYKFRCSEVAGRKTLNKDLLKDALIEELGEDRTDSLLDDCTKVGHPYQKLTISKNKGK